jgi:nitrilase
MARVAAIQLTSGTDVAANLAAVRDLAQEAAAAGAELVVVPENACWMGGSDGERQAVAEAHGAGPMQSGLAKIAAISKVWLVAGTVPLTTGDPRRVRSACLVYDSRGREVGRYDKIHLFDVDVPDARGRYRESAGTEPGTDPVVVETPVGRLGLAVCYDLRFPELFRRLVSEGAELIALPAAFTATTGRAHWEVLVRARAIEDQVFLIAAAQTGTHAGGRETHGDSMIVDPWGVVLARRPASPGVVLADLDPGMQRRVRRDFPVLTHRVLDN